MLKIVLLGSYDLFFYCWINKEVICDNCDSVNVYDVLYIWLKCVFWFLICLFVVGIIL